MGLGKGFTCKCFWASREGGMGTLNHIDVNTYCVSGWGGGGVVGKTCHMLWILGFGREKGRGVTCYGFCVALLCIALHCFAIALFCIAAHCFALLCIALHCFALLCIALHCFALVCFAVLRH